MENFKEEVEKLKKVRYENINDSKSIIKKMIDILGNVKKYINTNEEYEKTKLVSKMLYEISNFNYESKTPSLVDDEVRQCDLKLSLNYLGTKLTRYKMRRKLITTSLIYHCDDFTTNNLADIKHQGKKYKYFPVKLIVYMKDDLDSNKIYSADEIKKLVRDNQMFHFGEIIIDEGSKEIPSKKNNYRINNIVYTPSTIEIKDVPLNECKSGACNYFDDTFLWLNSDYKKVLKDENYFELNINKHITEMPNLLDSILESIRDDLVEEINEQKRYIKEVNAVYKQKYLLLIEEQKQYIKELEEQLPKISEELED